MAAQQVRRDAKQPRARIGPHRPVRGGAPTRALEGLADDVLRIGSDAPRDEPMQREVVASDQRLQSHRLARRDRTQQLRVGSGVDHDR
jgi:hypothetical protein